ncbi:winged helix-turn-helix domain-containing protein [Pseudoalteromonas luteoviolacea]|uniref:winged helix-turn-helix domain-containing protein n=1 Tax=Pseudoalteromonas luteoviolacea TaxID=43657 RepID=UPI001B35DDBE|nr:winged helix-turn-helix domain-containing protein [Pseudoalteromonas luteoviolacea]MBQ4812241.1 winged helix-turn-helix domain-containing protein [Pseudoalteromonas luteoviolacea]
MRLAFQDFQFDCQELTLSKDGRKISLKEKPAQILALLVTQPEKIHSKSEILEVVWPGRTVTEQVVFQNIGHLRALFGDDAIKTFSKKGYQWQLPLSAVSEQNAAPQMSEQSGSSEAKPTNEQVDVTHEADQQADSVIANKSSNLPWPILAPILIAAAAVAGYLALA